LSSESRRKQAIEQAHVNDAIERAHRLTGIPCGEMAARYLFTD
jgi:hypothetical protein